MFPTSSTRAASMFATSSTRSSTMFATSSLRASLIHLPLQSLRSARESSLCLSHNVDLRMKQRRSASAAPGLSDVGGTSAAPGLSDAGGTWEKMKTEAHRPSVGQMRGTGALASSLEYARQDDNSNKIQSISCEKKFIVIEWEDGVAGEFLGVWLRDNCKCSQCFHVGSQGRSLPLRDLDIDVEIAGVSTSASESTSTSHLGDTVVVNWSSGHVSTFESNWLRDRVTSVAVRDRKKSLWRNGFLEQMERFKFEEVMEDDEKLLGFLEHMEEFGICLIEEAPCELGVVRSICSRVGFPKTTHYGDSFEVRSKPGPSNLAYTGARLGLHLDQPYYKYTPGTQLLHCIRQHRGEGGDSQFVDGFAVAERIRQDHPEEWNTLTQVALTFYDEGVEQQEEDQMMRMSRSQPALDFIKARTTPTLRLEQGRLVQICFNNHSRSSWPVGDMHTVQRSYKALKLFENLCNDDEMMVEMKMKDGDIVIVDNMRVLHGRSEYSWEDGGDGRHVQGGYIDWDEIYSRINILQKNLEKPARYIGF